MLVEKPLASELSDALAMRAACAEEDVVLMDASMRVSRGRTKRVEASRRHARALVRRGELTGGGTSLRRTERTGPDRNGPDRPIGVVSRASLYAVLDGSAGPRVAVLTGSRGRSQ